MAFETLQERNYRELVENAGILILELDAAGVITGANRAAEEFFGRSSGELEGKNIAETLAAPAGEAAGRGADALRDLVREKRNQVRVELVHAKKTGENAWALWTFRPVCDAQGTLESIAAIGQDISGARLNEQSLRRNNRMMVVLARTTRKLNTVLAAPAVLRTLVAGALEITGARGGTVGLLSGGKMVFTEYHRDGELIPVHYEFAPGAGVPGWTIVNRKSYTTNDAACDPWLLPSLRREYGIYNLANIPIFGRQGELLGCFEIHNKAGREPFDDNDVAVLETLAANASVALDNAREFAEREKAKEEYRTIFETTGTAMAVLERDGTIALVNGEFERLSGCTKEEAEGKLNWRDFVTREDLSRAEQNSARLRAGENLRREKNEYALQNKSGAVRCCIVITSLLPHSDRSMVSIIDITERKDAEESLRQSEERLRLIIANSPDQIFQQDRELRYVWVPRLVLPGVAPGLIGRTDYDIFPQENAAVMAAQKHAVMATGKGMRVEENFPLEGRMRYLDVALEPWRSSEGEIVGVLGFARDVTDAKNDRDRLRASVEKEKKTSNAIIETMLRVVELRDPYTAGHEEHTAALASAIAREMGLSGDVIDGIRMAAIVHDIGKIFIPAEILSKPGVLSQAEFDIIKVHPSAGYDILRLIDFPWPVAEIVRQHHERYNGSGYPRGLKGDEILIQARILMVADVIDSIALHRPYRPRIGLEEALQEIRTNRGILYDPAVADAALKVFREHKFRY